MPWFYEENKLSREKVIELTNRVGREALSRICRNPNKVLLLPPDITRAHSGAGWITEYLYNFFSELSDVYLIPTLGQHVPHTIKQNRWMFGSVPEKKIYKHNWKNNCKVLGEINADYVKNISKSKADWPIPISLNRMLLDENWDIIINIGHVVPHEVLGFSNHNKNYFIGLGAKETICASHMMAACCGIENNLGKLITPLRACYNKAEKEFLAHLPHVYILLVMAYNEKKELVHTGFYVGDDIETYLMAAKASQKQNITIVPPLKKVVALMQEDEFHSTWVANKAIYRTRMAIAEGGELIIIAPGLKRFGEQPEVDALIRKYGYIGTEKVMKYFKTQKDLQNISHGAAHLIHGSSEGRFKIIYAPGHLQKDDIESVNYIYMNLNEALERYNPQKMKNGINVLPDGEEVYFIETPSVGLWTTKEKFYKG